MAYLEKYLGDKVVGRQKWYMLAIIGLVAVGFEGFRYVNWPFGSSLFVSSIFLLFLVYLSTSFEYSNLHFSNYVILFTILPFVSMIHSMAIFDQSLFESLYGSLQASLFWVLYFVLHKYRIKEITIMKALLCISLFIASIQIIQQFTYPNALFGVRSDKEAIEHGFTEIAEMRNGIWRFRMHINMYYTAPLLFFLYIEIQRKLNFKLIILFLILLVSVYLSLTRIVIFSTILTLLSYFIMNTKQIRYYHLIFLFVAIYVIWRNLDALFGEMIEKSDNELDDNIRYYATSYFWHESLRSFPGFLFGHGVIGKSNSLSHTLYNLGYYVSDVGCVGMIYKFGFIYTTASYCLLYRIYMKYRKIIPNYIRLFVVFVFVMSITIFPIGASHVMTMIWPLLLYICDLHINQSPCALKHY